MGAENSGKKSNVETYQLSNKNYLEKKRINNQKYRMAEVGLPGGVNPLDFLHKLATQRGLARPEFLQLGEQGLPHNKLFMWQCSFNNVVAQEWNKTEENDIKIEGMVRVGDLSKGLLLAPDRSVSLVLLCISEPSKTMLKQIHVSMRAKMKESGSEHDTLLLEKEAAFAVSKPLKEGDTDAMFCYVTFSSTSLRKKEKPKKEDDAEKKEAGDAEKKEETTENGNG